jgi:hypothetical protein
MSRELVERLGAVAADVQHPMFRWLDALYHCNLLTVFGTGDEIESAAYKAFQIGQEADQPDLYTWFAAQLGVARWAQGRFGEMVDVIGPATEDTPAQAAWRAAKAMALVKAGRGAEARLIVDELTAARESAVPVNLAWMLTHSVLAEAIALVGTAEQAMAEYDVLIPYEGWIPCLGIISRPSISHWLGELAARAGWGDRADSHFATSLAKHEALGAAGWVARTQLAWGRSLLGRGEDARGRPMIEVASAAATRLGAADVVREAALLSAAEP